MRRSNSLLARLCVCLVFLLAAASPARAEVYTFFSGTQYALDVHFLRGEKPGPTIIVQGGIQGDEYSGYLTAQLLTRAKVTKGTLIVVPRANPPSIQARSREFNVDLNRRFDKDYNQFFEDYLARLIRYLVDQSQGLIHLHEGSGFYNPVKLDDLHGPKRYGQSIIIDATEYKNMHLEQKARTVLAQLNDGLKPEQYKFKLFNMDTFSDRSIYLEHRKSLTYYTLTQAGVPAFAIEVSKNLVGRYWSHWKVSRQLQATELLLRQLGVEVETQPPRLEDFQSYPPQNLKVVVDGQALDPAKPVIKATPGVPLDVRCETNGQQNPLAPLPAVFASDRTRLNLLKAHRLPMSPFQTLDVRSDGVLLAKAQLSWVDTVPKPGDASGGEFVCWLNGELKVIPAGETLTAVQGDQLVLEGIRGSKREEVLNLKGYVTNAKHDDGQDAGNEIILDPKSFTPKFFLPCKTPGEYVCEVVRETPGQPRTKFLIRLLPRQVTTLVLATDQGATVTLPWSPSKPAQLPAGRYTLTDIQGNGPANMVQAFVGKTPLIPGAPFQLDDKAEITLRQTTTFAEMGKMAVNGKTVLSLAD